MTRKRARGTTMLDKLQTITRNGAPQSNQQTIPESRIGVGPEYRPLSIQRRPLTRAHTKPNEEFLRPQLTEIQSSNFGSGNQNVSGTSSFVQVGLQSIGSTSNPLSVGGSHVLGSRSYPSRVGSINVDGASNALMGIGATNSMRLMSSASFKVLDSPTITSQGTSDFSGTSSQGANNISDSVEISSQPIAKGSNATPSVSFQTYLGTIARNGVRFPLTFPSWKDMPQEILEDAWSEIQARKNKKKK